MNTRDQHGLVPGTMPDVQASPDSRQIPIQRVGVKDVRYPLRWRGDDGTEQPSVGMFNFYVALPADQKGTHMSRFIALLEDQTEALDQARLIALHAAMLERLDARTGRIELMFPLFVKKVAPISGVPSLMDYQLSVAIDGSREQPLLQLTVLVPVTSLCPSSKAISEYGAHNQRSHLTVAISSAQPVAPEQLIRLIEQQASSELWGLLKRVDEKFVTEHAYDNPKFVEDLVRDVAAALKSDSRISRFVVEAENFESIHNHSAYARIES